MEGRGSWKGECWRVGEVREKVSGGWTWKRWVVGEVKKVEEVRKVDGAEWGKWERGMAVKMGRGSGGWGSGEHLHKQEQRRAHFLEPACKPRGRR